MGKIILLDELTSCQIAAGEVVERPASVVKETVENSIDAGATRITVEIKNGGIKYIRIDDNGSGMEKDDCVIAFDKHATSKLRSADDLFSINTLGFRGEALASIAAVAKVTLRTKTAMADEGTEVIFEGGELLSNEPCGAKKGTSIIVENLFFNTPARYKFLKKDVTEGGYVADALEKVALCHPEISFTLISDRKQVLHTPGDGNIKSCFFSIFGPILTNQMKEISYTSGNITVSGLCGNRELSFGTRGRQFTFVNGRFIKNKTITTAVDEAYKTLVMKGKFPVVALTITCPPTTVDVNVHPAKTEVRFSDEQAIFKAVYSAIYATLFETEEPRQQMYADSGSHILTAEEPNQHHLLADQNMEAKSKEQEAKSKEQEAKSKEQEAKSEIEVQSNFVRPVKNIFSTYKAEEPVKQAEEINIFVKEEEEAKSKEQKAKSEEEEAKSKRQQMYADSGSHILAAEEPNPHHLLADQNVEAKSKERVLTENEIVYRDARVLGQLFDTYIMLELGDNFYLLDQHAAHERLKYEEFKNALENFDNNSQSLFLPETVKLSPSEYSKLEKLRETFEKLGFEIDDFGINTIIIRAIPTFLPIEKAVDFFVSSINEASVSENHINVFSDHAVFTLACKAAIKANRTLSQNEIEKLLRDLFNVKNPGTCPHGRPILVKYSKYEIERKFHRA